MADWFERFTGFAESSYEETKAGLEVVGEQLRSKANGRTCRIGRLYLSSLGSLRKEARTQDELAGPLSISNVIGEAGAMHRDPANAGALFQVASQFNLLEMVGPTVCPEHGVTRYASDRTQGPACAIAAGGATIFRNYFAEVDGQIGQTRDRQLDGLRDLGAALGNVDGSLWRMQNGYALPTEAGLARVDHLLASADASRLDELRALLRIGLHTDVEVTDRPDDTPAIFVSQAFCSALPVAYTRLPRSLWARFATLVLEAAYEATLWAALRNAGSGGTPMVFLTQLGGGAFGNEPAWIHAAIERALSLFAECALDVRIVSYRQVPADLEALAR